ncbi:MAG TPA: ATP-dependent sacrificial sulfur transferase LarE [Desulfosalsimonadaceae bacterium]|nr:ATP-dependent sacrificial sulfur transferase LarE [Desulfosalsimonadaceae bacterium]
MMDPEKKQKRLFADLGRYSSLLVAFSGGADSTYLIYAARRVLGREVLAVTALSGLHPEREAAAAAEIAGELDVAHRFVHTSQLESQDFLQNSRKRCYLCKTIMFSRFLEEARRYDIESLAHGSNSEDEGEFRPGLQAAKEMNVAAPLAEAGLKKADIRELSRRAGLRTWDKPATGCLATRIPYGTAITPERISRIEKAEQFLAGEGFSSLRVRLHGGLARIEVAETEMERLIAPGTRSRIVAAFQEIGFSYVAADLESFASGRMDRGGRKPDQAG